MPSEEPLVIRNAYGFGPIPEKNPPVFAHYVAEGLLARMLIAGEMSGDGMWIGQALSRRISAFIRLMWLTRGVCDAAGIHNLATNKKALAEEIEGLAKVRERLVTKRDSLVEENESAYDRRWYLGCLIEDCDNLGKYFQKEWEETEPVVVSTVCAVIERAFGPGGMFR